MPPQRVQRMVQYSHPPRPVRPGMIFSTTRPALHCGQLDSTGGGRSDRFCSSSNRGMAHSEITRLEAIDVVLGMRDRLFGIGPGEPDFERCKRQAVDDNRFLVGAPDPRVPKTLAGLKGFDVKSVVEGGHVALRVPLD